MTDPVDVATVLPKELRLGVPPKMPQARSYLFRQQSTLASYKPTETIQINIPRLQRSYLRKDSYLRFRLTGSFVQVNNFDSLVFDTAGAFGLFEKLEIFDYLGSTLLESISGIPQLSALLLDMGMKEIVENRNGNASMGLGQSYSYSGSGAWGKGTILSTPVVTTTANIQNTGFVLPPSSGDLLVVGKDASSADATPTTAAATVPFCREFAIPMPSFLGLLSEKMIPLHNGFTVILTAANLKTPFFVSQPHDLAVELTTFPTTTASRATLPLVGSYDSAVNWRLEDVYLDCQILELGPVAESMILSSSQGSPLVVHTKAMRNYVANINTNTPEFTLNMNLNVASLSNIMWIMRSADHLESNVYASYGNRTRNFLNKWQFQYGSTTLPQSNGIEAMGSSIPSSVVTTDTELRYGFLSESGQETYQELMKSRPVSLTSSRITGKNFNRDSKFNFNLDASAAVSAKAFNFLGVFPSYNSEFAIGRFAAGLNLQLANGKDGQIICGLNTNGMNTSIRGVFHNLYLALMDKVRVDAWAEYDAFINISPGIATTVSF